MIPGALPVKLVLGECHWTPLIINICSDKGLMADSTKPLPEPVLTQIDVIIWCHRATMKISYVLNLLKNGKYDRALCIFFKLISSLARRQGFQYLLTLWSCCWWPVATRSQGINTLRPRQNGQHFPDDIFKWIFLNENVWIAIKISLKFVPKGPINISALVQIMAWRRPGDKPLSEPKLI